MSSYKSNLNNEHPYPHMGKMLSTRIKAAGFRHVDIQKKLQLNRNAVNKYTQNPSLQAGILWNVGMVIKHNFFAEIASLMPIPFPDKKMDTKVEALEKELSEKQAQIDSLAKELAIYKEIVLRSK